MTGATTSTTAPQPQRAENLAQLPSQHARRRLPVPPSWTRHGLAWTVLGGYLVLLAATIGTAIALVFSSHPINDVQQVVVTLSGALSALAGILGFVIGFYFKTEESAAKAVPSTDGEETTAT